MKRTLNASISISDLQHRLSRFSRLSLADFQPHCLIDLVTGGTLVLFAYENEILVDVRETVLIRELIAI